MGGLSRFVDKRLKRYRGGEYKGKKSFHKLKAAQDIQGATGRLPNYHMIEMLNYLPGGRKNVFYRHLAQLFNWNEVDKTAERKFADLALSGHGKRFKEMQLLIISIKDSHIVFEVEARPLPAK